MFEEILGKDGAKAIYEAGQVHRMLEKRSGNNPLDYIGSFFGGAGKVLSSGADAIAKLGLYGLGAGTIGGVTYNLIKDRLEQESPEEEYNRKIEAMYKSRSRELDDAKWISKVRAMRDELKRGYKHMTTKEYTEKYNALLDALDERSA